MMNSLRCWFDWLERSEAAFDDGIDWLFWKLQGGHRRRKNSGLPLGIEVLPDRIAPATDIFTGGVIGGQAALWSDPNNWSLGALPSTSDVAVISSTSNCLLDMSEEQTIAGLTVEGSATIKSQLTVTPGGSGNGTTSVASGGSLSMVAPDISGVNSQLETTTLDTSGGGTFSLGASTSADIDVSGDLEGSSTISGLMTAKNINAYSGAQVKLGGTGTISGNGQIDAEVQAQFDVTGSWTIGPGSPVGSALKGGDVYVTGTLSLGTNIEPVSDIHLEPGGLITGSGALDITYTLDWDGGTLAPGGGTEIDGTLDVSGSASKTLGSNLSTVTETADFGDTGALVINSGATLEIAAGQADLSLPTIMTSDGGSGLFDVSPDGTLNVTASGVTITSNFNSELGSTLKVDTGSSLTLSNGGGVTMKLDPTAYLDGDVTLVGTVSSPSGFILNSGSGALKIGDGVSASGTLSLPSGQKATLDGGELEVSGTGTLAGGGEVSNTAGIMKVDIGGATPGLGSYVQSASGQLTLQAAGLGVYSSLGVTGEADLAGTLNLDLLDGYTPSSGTSFLVLGADPVNHEFNTVPPNMTASYTSTSVTLTED
jgi:hypothetical protein